MNILMFTFIDKGMKTKNDFQPVSSNHNLNDFNFMANVNIIK